MASTSRCGRLGLALVLLSGAAACATSGPAAPGGLGAPVELGLARLEGGTLETAALAGKIVLVDVWATWCKPCLASFPFYSELHAELSGRGLEIVAVSVDEDAAAIRRFLDGRPVPFRVVHDAEGRFPERMGVDTMPTLFLLDRAGRLAWRHAGFEAGDASEIRDRVLKALNAAPEADAPGGPR
jgi:thiol-disulfide isomerase/thioredoxin